MIVECRGAQKSYLKFRGKLWKSLKIIFIDLKIQTVNRGDYEKSRNIKKRGHSGTVDKFITHQKSGWTNLVEKRPKRSNRKIADKYILLNRANFVKNYAKAATSAENN